MATRNHLDAWETKQLSLELTPRERQVLYYISVGMTNREIGQALGISFQTVKNHTVKIYMKLNVDSGREATALIQRMFTIGILI